ncbi:PREDICTED: uncharacterized protein LOC109470090 [Branchiostoma belcheri]|uniref:Uncharacterized protein LOC109470090 n=1 Tax=Branchiostoma belcheri TaxID=7741 RepID=A0A6P4YJ18_BRABE|nr:PREDICTED: uncharacterized protein LOC109470090 [Branchiostoma belcheri]
MSTAGIINIQFPEQEHGVLSRLNAMRQQGQLCDIAVRAGQQEFPCHRAVLAASCGHFHSIFVQGVLCFPKKPTKETLDLSFISAEVFSIILDYIYTANLQCPAGMIEGVLQAAKLLEIEPLMRQLPVFVGDTAPISSVNHAPGVSVGGAPISYLNRGPSLNCRSPLVSSLGETPVSSLTHVSRVSTETQVIHPSDTVSSLVATSKTTVPESLAEMLTEPEENVHMDQPTSQRALDNVVVKQELPDLPDASQDTWSPPSPGFPPIPHLSPDNSDEEEESGMSSWSPWVNDEYSRVLSAEKVTELEQNCRRCGRKDNSVRYFIRTLKEWCLARNKPTDFETLPCGELSRLLQQFYYELRNPAGGRYGAQTMLAFRSAIKTYLIHHPAGTGYNIISDAAFTAANNTLQQVLKDCSIGFEAKCGIKSLNIPDLQKLFDTRTLGTSTPVSLQRLVWFYFTIHFHVRTSDEWLRLKKEDLTLHEDLTLQDQLGKEKAYFTLRRPGREYIQLEDRMYAAGGKLCPVAVTKLYLKKLNPFCSSLFQKPVRGTHQPRKGRWYKDHPPGQNYISFMMKGISEDAGLSLNYTNSRIRNTTRQDLVSAGIFPSPSPEPITPKPVAPVVAPLATSQHYNHSTPVTGSNNDLGASAVLKVLGFSKGMATPTSQQNQQVHGTLGSVMQSLSLPPGGAINGHHRADLCVKQKPVTELQLGNVESDVSGNGADLDSEVKKGSGEDIRRSTRKRKIMNFLEDSDDDQEDDWLSE